MRSVEIATRPEPLSITADDTAVVVNDMQNAFCSPGGYLDLIGFDIAPAVAVVDRVRRVVDAARRAGVAAFHGQNGLQPGNEDAPRQAPIWLKSPAASHAGVPREDWSDPHPRHVG